MKKERQPGFYWVFHELSQEWEIREWVVLPKKEGSGWILWMQEDLCIDDECLLEIIETPILPPSK